MQEGSTNHGLIRRASQNPLNGPYTACAQRATSTDPAPPNHSWLDLHPKAFCKLFFFHFFFFVVGTSASTAVSTYLRARRRPVHTSQSNACTSSGVQRTVAVSSGRINQSDGNTKSGLGRKSSTTNVNVMQCARSHARSSRLLPVCLSTWSRNMSFVTMTAPAWRFAYSIVYLHNAAQHSTAQHRSEHPVDGQQARTQAHRCAIVPNTRPGVAAGLLGSRQAGQAGQGVKQRTPSVGSRARHNKWRPTHARTPSVLARQRNALGVSTTTRPHNARRATRTTRPKQ